MIQTCTCTKTTMSRARWFAGWWLS